MTIHISLLFLHKRRIGDLKIWLRSIERQQPIAILLLTSNQTEEPAQELIADSNHQIEVVNLDKPNKPIAPKSQKSQIANFFAELRFSFGEFRRSYRNAKTILKPYRQTVVVTYDNRMPVVLAVLKAAKSLKLPVFLPSLLIATPSRNVTTANTLRPMRQIEKWLVRLIRRFLPHQISNEGRLYYDPVSLLLLLMKRSLPENPWATGNQRLVDRIGIESIRVRDELLAFGVSSEKMVVTGLPAYDFMDFSVAKTQSSPAILLFALPQYAEHGAMKLVDALTVIRPIFQALTSFDGRVIISLHPRMNLQDYRGIIDEFKFEWTLGGVDEWLKSASMFVATNSSSTIYWALMLGIPTIVLNHTYPKSDAFRDFQSLRYVDDDVSLELPQYLKTHDDQFPQRLAADQEKLSKPLVSDGNCGARNIRIISQLKKDTPPTH